MQLGDHVRVLACECSRRSHAGRHGIVTSLSACQSIARIAMADEILLNETLTFPEPPLNEVCSEPLYLELLP